MHKGLSGGDGGGGGEGGRGGTGGMGGWGEGGGGFGGTGGGVFICGKGVELQCPGLPVEKAVASVQPMTLLPTHETHGDPMASLPAKNTDPG